nr:MAG TPA: hypothetical protein [Crassvirales sp.]
MDIKAILRDKLIARYGEENVGFFSVMGSSVSHLGVYFDALTITTSRGGKTHTIKGVCFGFTFYNNFINVVCARHIYTLGELREGYIHSHVQLLTDEHYYKNFCLGTSPYRVIAQNIQNLLNGDDNIELDEGETLESIIEDNLESLVVAFDQMIRIESYEGGPYLSLNRLMTKETSDSINLNHSYTEFGSLRLPPEGSLAYTIVSEASEDALADVITFLNYCRTIEAFNREYEEEYNFYGYGEFGPECRSVNTSSSSHRRDFVHPIIFKDEVKAVVIEDGSKKEDYGNWIKCSINYGDLLNLYKKAILNKKIKQQNENRL